MHVRCARGMRKGTQYVSGRDARGVGAGRPARDAPPPPENGKLFGGGVEGGGRRRAACQASSRGEASAALGGAAAPEIFARRAMAACRPAVARGLVTIVARAEMLLSHHAMREAAARPELAAIDWR